MIARECIAFLDFSADPAEQVNGFGGECQGNTKRFISDGAV